MKPTFSIRTALRFGWEKTREHSGLMFGVVLVLALLSVAHSILNTHPWMSVPQGVASIFLLIVEILVSVGSTIIVLRLAKNEPASFGMLIPPWSLAWRYVLASLIAAIIITIGIGIPVGFGLLAYHTLHLSVWGKVCIGLCAAAAVGIGIYLMLMYSLVKFVAVDGVRPVLTIVRNSMHLVRGVKWKLLFFFILIVLLNILGLIVFFVGLLITIPVTLLACAQVYLTLKAQHSEK